MAAKKAKKAAKKTTKQKATGHPGGASTKRKAAPRKNRVPVGDALPETPQPITPGDNAQAGGDPLRRPVLLFTATTLLVFGGIYYVYGPCSDFSRLSRPAMANPDSPAPALSGDEAGAPIQQAEPDAAFIEALRLAYPKKGVAVDAQLGASLEPVARYLKNHPRAELSIIGHTCNIGQHPDNDRLSLERADAVRDYLIARGVARRRLSAIGRGEREPIASNSSDAGRIRNRRVEFRVTQ